MTTRRKGGLAFVVVVALLLLAFTLPLVNVNRYQRRIASSMSATLGRPVHLDRVSLHLLPTPGFRLENLVVSEDPAFGSEPVIRANVVDARLRPSSLWRRQVEFSTLHFEEPSVNLVRDAQGRWNLQSLLRHAAAVDSAPTAQQKAGPTPRFPYIEATGARLNLKLGAEKEPFSLTDADFALWLPSPERWRVRIEGRPARTDTSLSDPGVISLEGSLDRPQKGSEEITHVPVDLHATWRKVPLGEASKFATGADQNWRGAVTLEAAVQGRLDAANVTSTLHIEDLHRADFYPARTVDLKIACTAKAVVAEALLRGLQCTLPVNGTNVATANMDELNISAPGPAVANVAVKQMPLAWVLDWIRLWTPRVPVQDINGTGDATLALTHAADGWSTSGQVDMTLPDLATVPAKGAAPPVVLHWLVLPQDGAVLTPVSLAGHGGASAALTASVTAQGYTYSLDGTATSADLKRVFGYLPSLEDGLDPNLLKPGIVTAAPIDLTCSRAWEQPQTCHAVEPVAPVRPRRHRR